MMRALLSSLFCSLLLAACGGEEFSDLKQFVEDAQKDLRGKTEPLPEVKPYEPFPYTAFDLPDPFKPRKIEPLKGRGGGLQPDLNRPKEPLEAYPLESLSMVGVIKQGKAYHALIKTPDRTLYRVKVGNYMGQNFGIITDINEADVILKELVQDSAGDWSEQTSTLQLQEEQEQKK
jgi:type IV pilus assembly protein PilP